MFIVFRGYFNENFSTWIESMMGMFRVSLGAFGDIYETFDESIPNNVYVWVPRVSQFSIMSICLGSTGKSILYYEYMSGFHG